MTFNRAFCAVASIVAACLAVPQLAQADPDTNQLQLAVDPDFAGGSGYNDQNLSGVGALGVSGAATGGANSIGDGSGTVNYGTITSAGEFAGSGDTLVRGIYNDQFTITSASVANGTVGTLTFGVSIDAALNPILSGASGFYVNANIGGGASQINLSGTDYAPDSGTAYQGYQPGVFLATASFIYGQATTLSVEVQMVADVGYSINDVENNLTPYASFKMASYWQGFSDVTANGQAVPNFIVDSYSGTAWGNSFQPAVTPEPMTILLPIAGGLLLLRRKRS